MKNAQNGSMLLEALIALGLTSFLMLSITHITKIAIQAFKETVAISSQTQKIIAVTNLLHKDLSSLAVLPTPKQQKDEPAEKTAQQPNAQPQIISRVLIAQADEQQAFKIDKKEYQTFKLLNGITTSPLTMYGEQKPHLVRFCYKLIKQTLPRPYQKIRSFKLYRKETIKLDDLNIKHEETIKQSDIDKNNDWILICDNINDLFIEYAACTQNITSTAQAQQKQIPEEDVALETSFEWPNKKLGEKFQQRAPNFINIILKIWNPTFSKAATHQMIIPCLAYSGTLPEYSLENKSAQQKPADPSAPKTTNAPVKQVEKPTASTPPQESVQPLAPHPLPLPKAPTETVPLPPMYPQQPSERPHAGHHHSMDELPDDVKELLNHLENSPLGQIDPEKILRELPPELAKEVQAQMEEFEKHPEKMLESLMEMFK